jgi:hypothetical protein
LETLAVNGDAIQDFLLILVLSADLFKEMPGKYWDLSPFGKTPIVGLNKVFIWIEEKQFRDYYFFASYIQAKIHLGLFLLTL